MVFLYPWFNAPNHSSTQRGPCPVKPPEKENSSAKKRSNPQSLWDWRRVKIQGIEGFWIKEQTMDSTITSLICMFGAWLLILMIFLAASVRIVREDTRLAVYRLGRYLGDKGPGLVILIPLIDRGIVKQLGAVEKTPSTVMVGAVGETRTTVYTDGKVFLASEEWDAISRSPISAGQRVRVVRMVLEVEKEE
jgi:hypothetical protein